jgi:putative transposase
MLHSFTKIYIHLVWSTKTREPLLVKDVRSLVEKHILDYSEAKEINILSIKTQIDHVHVLISLGSDQKVDDLVKLMKGESSHWINSENLIRSKFSWQRGYGAFSVSSSHVEVVKKYILNQDEHHRTKTYGEELRTILQKYGYSLSETDESVLE